MANSSTGRLFALFVGFATMAGLIWLRLAHLELHQGDTWRAAAVQLRQRTAILPAPRGRILARDGAVLAYDRPSVALAVQYRYLESPPDARWLRAVARTRLPRSDRRDSEKLAAAESALRVELAEMHRRLAAACGLTADQWRARAARIQRRVEAIAQQVNRRNAAAALRSPHVQTAHPAMAAFWSTLFRRDGDPSARRIVVAEELTEHIVHQGLPPAAAAQILTLAQQYPGITVVEGDRREYPQAIAPHILGYLGAAPASSSAAAPHGTSRPPGERLVGRAGVEQQYELVLMGAGGLAVEVLDRTGRVIATRTERPPVAGLDLLLTLDPSVQRTAEALLDAALARATAASEPDSAGPRGGAMIVLDARSGAVLAAASAPRFDPAVFASGDDELIQDHLGSPQRPLFDRSIQMAIPPGSVFKLLTAMALLDSGVDPAAAFDCRGYLRLPDRDRCLVFRRFGVGHGELDLYGALAQSCNVYFFHHAEQLGIASLTGWAARLGCGQPTGIDLPGEAAGRVPAANASRRLPWSDDDTRAVAIGQGQLTTTPLQIARMMAAIANGGYLVTPHVALEVRHAQGALHDADDAKRRRLAPHPAVRLTALTPEMLAHLREGVRRAVADPTGTAHAALTSTAVPVAGKTGTAETGDRRGDHAWFAGFAPVDRPRIAFVIALEHGGSGAVAAAPLARQLIARLDELGHLGQH